MRNARINKWISRAKINPFLRCVGEDNIPLASTSVTFTVRASIINFNASVRL